MQVSHIVAIRGCEHVSLVNLDKNRQQHNSFFRMISSEVAIVVHGPELLLPLTRAADIWGWMFAAKASLLAT